MKTTSRKVFALFTLASVVLSGHLFIFGQKNVAITGPSSSQSPYVLPFRREVITKSILTVGDSVNLKPDGATPYRMVGIPDGLGAFDNGDGTFTLLSNHEIASGGDVRAHGANGAFVSRWIIRKRDLKVLHGEDLMQRVIIWNSATNSYDPPTTGVTFARFCSADLPLPSAFFNERTGLGYRGRIFMDGEETGNEGRGMGHLMNGTSYQLPRLGRFSWENSVANPSTGDTTLVAGTDDSTPGGQVYIYIGHKTNSGSPIDKAGLNNGNLYGVKVDGVGLEDRLVGVPSGTHFSLVNLGNVANKTGAQLQADSVAAGVTEFLRPEDGTWDTSKISGEDEDRDNDDRRGQDDWQGDHGRGHEKHRTVNDFYFVTTDRFDTVKEGLPGTPTIGRSRLYRLHFFDINDPVAGGVIETLLDGTEAQQMMDNITVDRQGNLVICEDPGNQAYVASIWYYDTHTDVLTKIAQHDPARFAPGGANFLTQDEESSGVIDATDILGAGWFLLDVQAHYATDSELVEGGQLLALYNPASH